MNKALGDKSFPFQQKEDTGELMTYNTHLADILGEERLISNKRLMAEENFAERTSSCLASAVQQSCLMDCTGMSTLTLHLAGTWAGTVTFEVTANDNDWFGIYGITPILTTIPALTTTAVGIFKFNVAGFKQFRARCSAYTSGIISMDITATSSPTPLAHAGFVYDPSTVTMVTSTSSMNVAMGSIYFAQNISTAVVSTSQAVRVLPVGSKQVTLQQQPTQFSPTANVLSTRDGLPGGGELIVVNKDPLPMTDQHGQVTLIKMRLQEEILLRNLERNNLILQTADSKYGSRVNIDRDFIEVR
jgi:hypothetical protein